MIMQELVRRSNEDTRRLRSIEQRLDAIESRLSSMEQAQLDRSKKANAKFAEHDVSLKSLSDELEKIKNSLDKISRQITDFARKRDLKEIEKMFELISPIREEFVTKDELEEELKYNRQ
jgi:septal ring factor EnvC (AmiA/AmiB activator)